MYGLHLCDKRLSKSLASIVSDDNCGGIQRKQRGATMIALTYMVPTFETIDCPSLLPTSFSTIDVMVNVVKVTNFVLPD